MYVFCLSVCLSFCLSVCPRKTPELFVRFSKERYQWNPYNVRNPTKTYIMSKMISEGHLPPEGEEKKTTYHLGLCRETRITIYILKLHDPGYLMIII